MDVHDVEIGTTAIVGVELVQGQGTGAGGHVRAHPAQRALFGLVQDRDDRLEAEAVLAQFLESGLDATLSGMGDPERQDLAGYGCGHQERWLRAESVEQRDTRLVAPGIEGLPWNLGLPAQLRDHAVFALVCQHPGRPLRPLSGRAKMRLTHRVLPGSTVVGGTSTIAPGSLFVREQGPTVNFASLF